VSPVEPDIVDPLAPVEPVPADPDIVEPAAPDAAPGLVVPPALPVVPAAPAAPVAPAVPDVVPGAPLVWPPESVVALLPP
jgi:hypothetical protein